MRPEKHVWLCVLMSVAILVFTFPKTAVGAEIPADVEGAAEIPVETAQTALYEAGLTEAEAVAVVSHLDPVERAELVQSDLNQQGGAHGVVITVAVIAIVVILIIVLLDEVEDELDD